MAAEGAVRLDVGLAEGADPQIVLSPLGDAVVTSEPVPGLAAITVDVPADQATTVLETLSTTPGVRFAQRGAVVQADGESSSAFRGSQVSEAWTWTTGSPDVTIAVVDTGVTPTGDLAADRLVPGHDFVDGHSDTADDDGHGTAIASVLGADHDNKAGFMGVCDSCRIMPVRVLQDRGESPADGTTADVAAGIVWAADHGAQIINLSLSTDVSSRLLEDAVQHAATKGVLVVASAGNARSTARRYPAAFESVIAVGQDGGPVRNTYSDRWIDFSANPTGEWMKASGHPAVIAGASVSAAVVSGVAALGLSMNPDTSAPDLRARMMRAAGAPTGRLEAPQVNAAHLVHHLGGSDTVPPVVTSTGLTAGEQIPRLGKIVRTVATDDHGVERIEVRIDGKVVAKGSLGAPSVTVRVPDGYNGSVPVVVRAYDYAGNTGETEVVVQADTSGPAGTVISPARGAVVKPWSEVIVESPDADAESVLVSQGQHGGRYALKQIPGTRRWQGPVVFSGSGHFTVELYDKTGNLELLHHSVTIDEAPPAGGTITPRPGTKLRGNFVSSVTNLVDTAGVARAELWVNGRSVGVDHAAPFELPVRPGSFSGTVQLVWRVEDRLGHARTLATHTVVADNKAPTVSITKAPKNKAKVKGTTRVYVKASDHSGIARVELIVNGKVVARDVTAGYVLSFNASKQKKTMKVQVRAYDKLGNVVNTTARTWYRK